MKFADVEKKVAGLPATPRDKGESLYNFILKNAIFDILEIGTAHGKSAIYMAAALEEKGRGSVTTLDVPQSQNLNPNAELLSKQCGLTSYVKPLRAHFGSHWLLREMIIQKTNSNGVISPLFDFCYIDAFHSWENAGLDFFLSDKLLRIGSWILFDDLGWTFSTSPSWTASGKISALPEDYRNARHVNDVFNYLVKQHPSYHNFRIDGRFGWAQKIK